MSPDEGEVIGILRRTGARFAFVHGSRAEASGRRPLWLAGRVAQHGRLLFDDDPPARVTWQAETRLMYLDEATLRATTVDEFLGAVADGRR